MSVILLFLIPIVSKSERYPISSTYASFIPFQKIYVVNDHTNIIKHTNIAPLINNMLNLTSIHKSILEQAKQANISLTDIATVSTHTHDSIETLAGDITNAIHSLHHPVECITNVRKKRYTQVIQPTGIFPQVGHLWSWLTGSLDSRAASVINRNSRDLLIIKQSQAKSLQVLNHTLIQSHKNTQQLNSLKFKIQTLGKHLSTKIQSVENKIIISNMFNDLMFTIKQLHRSVDEMTTEWHWASIGKMGPKAFKHGLFSTIHNSLDPITRSIHNIRQIIKQSAKLTVEACASHIYIKITIPLLDTPPLTAYKIHTNPIWHKDHYEQLTTNTAVLAWTQQKSYQFTQYEINQCTTLKTLNICKPPQVTLPLKHSCLFNLLHNTQHSTHTCKVRKVSSPPMSITQQGNFIVYTIPNNQSQLLNIKCRMEKLRVKQIKESGIIHIKDNCKIAIGNFTFSNNHQTYIFNTRPIRITTNTNISIKHNSFAYNDQTNDTTLLSIDNDIKTLQVASDILGRFEINPDIIIVASGVSTIILLCFIILVIILYTHICCSPFSFKCNKKPDNLTRYPIYRGSTR